MKYLAIMKDSLLEAIDTKVFYVAVAISVLFVLLMATLTFTPNPPQEGMQKLAERFADGSIQIDLPILGRVRATESLVQYKIGEISEPANPAKPWEAEYRFVLETIDNSQFGFRTAVLMEAFQAEETQAGSGTTKRPTRGMKWRQELEEEARRLEAQESMKKLNDQARAQRLMDEMRRFVVRRLQEELVSLKPEELEEFIRQQLENQGNWTVTEVKQTGVKPVKIKVRVFVPEGEGGQIKTEEVLGEEHQFTVTMTNRAGTYRLWPHQASLLFGAVPLGSSQDPARVVNFIQRWIINNVGAAVILLLSCIITSFFIPNMLRKGTVDLLLAKPISRWALLCYKYVGGLTFMFINTVIIIGGFWLAIGLRAGIWESHVLLMILVLTFEFALFYAVSTLLAVLTRSPVVCILGCILLWGLLFAVGWGYNLFGGPRDDAGAFTHTLNISHAVLPHYFDLDKLSQKVLQEAFLDPSPAERQRLDQEYKLYYWDESVLVTLAYIGGMLGLACWRFNARDY
jgi:ABC-type transport system involved in multi-copper enzyme maturation permease subunit/ribosomal protein L31E